MSVTSSEIAEALATLGPYGEDAVFTYSALLEAERDSINEQLARVGNVPASKAVLLAAARVHYKITLIQQSSNKVTSFRAGDVSISEGNEALENAAALLREIEADCPSLTAGDAFAFETV